MDRIQSIKEYITTFQYEWMKKKVRECKSKTFSDMQCVAEQVLLQVKEAQIQGDSRFLCFVSLFHYRSSLWTGSYRYQISAFEDTLYLSAPLVTADFVPKQIYNDTEELRSAVELELKKQFVRLTSFELQMAVRTILEDYQKLVEIYWSQMVRVLANSDTFCAIHKQNNWKFLSGTYMDDLRIVLQSENRR